METSRLWCDEPLLLVCFFGLLLSSLGKFYGMSFFMVFFAAFLVIERAQNFVRPSCCERVAGDSANPGSPRLPLTLLDLH